MRLRQAIKVLRQIVDRGYEHYTAQTLHKACSRVRREARKDTKPNRNRRDSVAILCGLEWR